MVEKQLIKKQAQKIGGQTRDRVIVEIDLRKCRENIRKIRETLPKEVAIMLVIKANAYGLGAIELSQCAIQEGVSMLAVATIEEAQLLRENGVQMPILMFVEPIEAEIDICIAQNISVTVYSEERVSQLGIRAKEKGQKIAVHVKVDTGMTRLGCNAADVMSLIKRLQQLPYISLKGVYSHLASSEDVDPSFTEQQLKKFNDIIQQIDKHNITVPYYHIANSGGVINHSKSYFNMVRIGLIAYQDSVRIKCKVMYIRHVDANISIGYHNMYITKEACQVAVISAGYADGIPSSLTNKGSVLIQGQRCPIIGRICMDFFMVKLPDVSFVCEKDEEVILIGSQGQENITLDEVAKQAGKNPREVLCGFGKRVKYVYKS